MSAFHESGSEDILGRDAALRGLARRLVANEHDLEDVVQDTWLAAIEQPRGRVRNLDGWMRTVVKYTASRKRRRDAERHRREIARASDSAGDELEGGEGPSEEALAAVGRSVQALRDPYRRVVELRFFEGLSVTEICERLDRPHATVKSQLRRARVQLRESMDREYAGQRQVWRTALFLALRLDAPMSTPPPPGGATAEGSGALTGASIASHPAAWIAAVVISLAAAWTWLDTGRGPEELASVSQLASEPRDSTDAGGGGVVSPAAERSIPQADRRAVSAEDPEPLPAPAGGPASVRVTGVERPGGAPVGDLPILVEPVSPSLIVSQEARIERLDASGSWSGTLDAGRWRLSPFRGESTTLDVADVPLEVELVVPEGVELGGRVLDPLDRPLSGARILVSWPDRRDCWLPIDQSDLQGDYHVVVDALSWIYATADGRSPSPIHSVGNSAGLAAEPLRLELGFIRPMVPGYVRDAAGQPVAGASVGAAVLPSLGIQLGPDGSWWTNRMPCRTTTDARGRFAVDRVNPTTNQIVVTAPGYTPWRGILFPGIPREPMDVVLQEANHLVGRALDAEGQPLPEAWITVEQVWPFGKRHALTGADGRFVIAELAPGDLTVRASHAQEGSVSRHVTIEAGQTAEVDLELSRNFMITGRATGIDHEALGGWSVVLVPRRALDEREALPIDETWGDFRTAKTGPGGRFRFLACEDEEHLLMLFPPEAGSRGPSGLPHAWLDGVRPGDRTLSLAVSNERPATGSVSGTLLCDPQQAHVLKVLLRSTALNHAILSGLDENGGFRFDELLPGDYEVFSWKPSRPPSLVARVELEPKQALDLEHVRMPADGALFMEIAPPAGFSFRELRVQLVSRYSRIQGSLLMPTSAIDVQPDGTVFVESLPPGDYHLRIESEQFADLYTRVRVEEGEETYRAFQVQHGRDFLLRMTSTVPLQPHERIDIAFHPEGGGDPIPFDFFQPTVPEGPFFLSFRFPEGAYRIAATSSSGLVGEGRVDLNEGSRGLEVALALGRP